MYSARTRDNYHLADVEELIMNYHYENRVRDWDTWLKVEPRFVLGCKRIETNSVLDLHDEKYPECGKLELENDRVLRYYDDCSGCRCGPWPGSPCCCNLLLDKDVPTFDVRFRIEKGVIYARDNNECEVDPLELLFALTFRWCNLEYLFAFFINADYPNL